MSNEVFLVLWSKCAKLLGCATRTLDNRAKRDLRHKPTIVGTFKYLRSTQIEAIQQGLQKDQIHASKAGIILPPLKPKASPLDRIGAIELEAESSGP